MRNGIIRNDNEFDKDKKKAEKRRAKKKKQKEKKKQGKLENNIPPQNDKRLVYHYLVEISELFCLKNPQFKYCIQNIFL